MAVGDGEQAVSMGLTENKCCARTNVNMHGAIIMMFSKESAAESAVCGSINSVEAKGVKNPSAELDNLRIVITFAFFMNKKVELKHGAIDCAIHIHD